MRVIPTFISPFGWLVLLSLIRRAWTNMDYFDHAVRTTAARSIKMKKLIYALMLLVLLLLPVGSAYA